MRLIDHSDVYKVGHRVLLLTGRHKDGIEKQRRIFRISTDLVSFNTHLVELQKLANPNERIYSTASARDLSKAVRHFEFAQLEARYNDQSQEFYENLHARWISSLMAPTSVRKDCKIWMLDCDTDDDIVKAKKVLKNGYSYAYETKNGKHFLFKPIDKRTLSYVSYMLDTNPLMLWGY